MNSLLLRTGFSARLIAVLAGVMLLPVLLAVFVFPTPLYDTRELIAWGRQFPIVTPVHPPLMVWVGGAVDLLFGSSGAVIVLAGQCLLAVGLAYAHAILCLVTDRRMAVFFTVLCGTSFYAAFGPLSWALNADILQLTSWPAVLYHFLRANRTDRWTHWVLFGCWSAIAALTKYNAAILFIAMAASILWLPAFRKCLRRPGPYVALSIGLLLFLPHAIAAVRFGTTIAYGVERFHGGNSISDLPRRIAQFLLGFAPLLTPGWIVVAICLWRGLMTARLPRFGQMSDDLQFITAVNIVMTGLLLGMIAGLGLEYIARYGAPFALLAIFSLAPSFSWAEDKMETGERDSAIGLGTLYAALAVATSVAYLMFFSHSGLQEPTAEAAHIIMTDWNSRYRCGPAYFLGERQTVYGVGIEAGPGIDSLSVNFISEAPWFDANKLHAQGAVLVYSTPWPHDEFEKLFPSMALSEEKRIVLPVLRTHNGKTKDYFYRLAAPENCGR